LISKWRTSGIFCVSSIALLAWSGKVGWFMF
jgi:hypothetical protein